MQEVVLLVDLPAPFVRSVNHLEARLGVAISLKFVSFSILTRLLNIRFNIFVIFGMKQ